MDNLAPHKFPIHIQECLEKHHKKVFDFSDPSKRQNASTKVTVEQNDEVGVRNKSIREWNATAISPKNRFVPVQESGEEFEWNGADVAVAAKTPSDLLQWDGDKSVDAGWEALLDSMSGDEALPASSQTAKVPLVIIFF